MTQTPSSGIIWPGDDWPSPEEAGAAQVRLRGISASVKGKVWTGEGKLRIGRMPGLEMIVEEPMMSPCHAELRFSRRGWLLRDSVSTTGTFLNGRRLVSSTDHRSGIAEWYPVQPGDAIRTGETVVGVCFLRLDGPGQILRVAADLAARFDACWSNVYLEWGRKNNLVPTSKHRHGTRSRVGNQADLRRLFREGQGMLMMSDESASVSPDEAVDLGQVGSRLYLPLWVEKRPVALVELFRSFAKRPFSEEESRQAVDQFGRAAERYEVFDNPILPTVEAHWRSRFVLHLAEVIQRNRQFRTCQSWGMRWKMPVAWTTRCCVTAGKKASMLNGVGSLTCWHREGSRRWVAELMCRLRWQVGIVPEGKSMTEQEWLACTHPTPMLDFVRGKASDRKLRLFAYACCRLAGFGCSDIPERFADGKATADEMADLMREVESEGVEIAKARVGWPGGGYTLTPATCEPDAQTAARDTAYYVAAEMSYRAAEASEQTETMTKESQQRIIEDERKRAQALLADLLREIIGNPFRCCEVPPFWLQWNDGTIGKISQGIYDEHAFDTISILADAVEEAGCDNAEILGHLRGSGPHFRGCWVVDLLLGRKTEWVEPHCLSCSKCGQRLRVPMDKGDLVVRCSKCRHSWDWSPSSPPISRSPCL